MIIGSYYTTKKGLSFIRLSFIDIRKEKDNIDKALLGTIKLLHAEAVAWWENCVCGGKSVEKFLILCVAEFS